MTQRYEREIEELLKRMDGRLKPEPLPRRVRRRTARLELALLHACQAFLRRSPVEQFMIASIVLVLVSGILQWFSPRAAFYAGVISVLLLVLAIVVSIANHRGGGYSGDKRWRGRPIDAHSSGPAWWTQAQRWWWAWRHRRRF